MRPHRARTQCETFPSGIHKYNLHGPMGRASYTCEFHCGMHCVVYAPIGGGYNATHSRVEFTGITCAPQGGLQVIPVNSTWGCVALYPPPMGTYTTQCIPRGNFMGSTWGGSFRGKRGYLGTLQNGTHGVPFCKVPKRGFET